MAHPKIAGTTPILLTLEPGEYYWCRCGHSTKQPYCDGSHEGTGMSPMPFTIDEQKKVALCLCKHTSNPPFCDGAHRKL